MLTVLVAVHILAGAVGLLAGFCILFLAKGRQWHKRVGGVFFYTMMVLGLTGAIVGLARWIPLSALNGLLVCHFVLTSRLAIRPVGENARLFEWLLVLFGAFMVAGYVWFSLEAHGMPDGKLGGFGSVIYIVFAGIAAFALAGDVLYLLVKAWPQRVRVIRHLWRMFFPLFMATAAFFLGQAKLFPAEIQKSLVLALPVVVVISAMLFWLASVFWGQSKIYN